MADAHDIDVFFSYDHNDRETRSAPGGEVRRNGWAVWWDTGTSIGSVWRDVLTDRCTARKGWSTRDPHFMPAWALPASASTSVEQNLDGLILMVSNADGGLFAVMPSKGMALQNQAAVLANLLVAGQVRDAEARFRGDEAILFWFRQEVSEVPGSSNDACAEADRLLKDTGSRSPAGSSLPGRRWFSGRRPLICRSVR